MHKIKIATILSLAILLSACDSPAEKAAKFYNNGVAYYEEGKFAKANVELRNAIQLNPDNADAYYHLALVNEKQKKWQQMFSNLAWSIKLKPDNYMAYVKMAQLYLLSGEVADAKENLEKAFKLNQQDIAIYNVRAAIRYKDGDIEGARQDIETVLASQPKHENALSLKAVILNSTGQQSQAITLLSDALKESPDSLILHMLHLKLLSESKQHDAIKKGYADVIRQFPKMDELFYQYIGYLQNNGYTADAISAIETKIENNPGEDKPKSALISLLAADDLEKAKEQTNLFLQAQPENLTLLMTLADIMLKQKDIDAAIPVLEKIETLGGQKEKNAAQVNLAQIDLIKGNEERALATLKTILANDERNVAALKLHAKILFDRQEYSQAIADLRIVLSEEPNSDSAYILLARAYLKTGADDLAHDSYKQAMDVNPSNAQAYMPIVSRLLENKNSSQAERIVIEILEQDPENDFAKRVLAQLKMMSKDWDGVEELVKQFDGSQNQADRLYAKFLSARVWQEQKRYNDAIRLYKEVLEAQPKAKAALQGMAASYLALDQLPQLQRYLDNFINKHPMSTDAYVTSALLHMRSKSYPEALRILESGFNTIGDDQGLYSTQAKVHRAAGDMEASQQSFKNGLKALPESLFLKVEFAMLLEEMGNHQAAITLYEQVLSKNPNIDIAANNYASIISDYYPSDDKLQQASKFSAHFKSSKQPYFLDTYGWLQFKKNNIQEALIAIERAALLAPNEPVFQLHLGQIYKKNNDIPSAKARLQDAVELAKKSNNSKLVKEAEAILHTL